MTDTFLKRSAPPRGGAGPARVAAASGLVFLALFVAHRVLQGAGPLQGAQAADPSATAIAAYVAAHQQVLFLAEYVNGLGVLTLVVFVAALTRLLRTRGAGLGAEIVLGTGLLFAATALVATAGQTGMAALASTDVSVGRALFVLQAYAPITLTIAGFMAAVSVALPTAGLVSRRLGGVGLIAALLILVGAAAQARIVTSDFLAPKGPAALVGAVIFLA